jgi:hypothetical protein
MSVIGAAVYRMEQHVSSYNYNNNNHKIASNNNNGNNGVRMSTTTSEPLLQQHNHDCSTNITSQLNSEDRVIAAALHGIAYDECATREGRSDIQQAQAGVAVTDHVIVDEVLQFDTNGAGKVLGLQQYSLLEQALSRLQVLPSSILKLQDTPIGRGGFAKVYKVMLNKRVCAAKVCQHQRQIY